MDQKYFTQFNFYFAKPINEILANVNLPHVILFKDQLYDDADNGYLKRIYSLEEIPQRLNLLGRYKI